MSEPDELYEDAVKLVREYGHGTSRLLQVNLRIGWGRAWSLLETMTENGVLGPEDGLKPRKVLRPAVPGSQPAEYSKNGVTIISPPISEEESKHAQELKRKKDSQPAKESE